MYKWVDQPYITLEPRARFLVWAMRRWWHDNATVGCGSREVGPAFHCYGRIAALPHFQIMMLALRDTLIEPFRTGWTEVSEHEAIVLSLLAGAANSGSELDAERLAGFVTPQGAQRLAGAIAGLADKLAPQSFQAWNPSHQGKKS